MYSMIHLSILKTFPLFLVFTPNLITRHDQLTIQMISNKNTLLRNQYCSENREISLNAKTATHVAMK